MIHFDKEKFKILHSKSLSLLPLVFKLAIEHCFAGS